MRSPARNSPQVLEANSISPARFASRHDHSRGTTAQVRDRPAGIQILPATDWLTTERDKSSTSSKSHSEGLRENEDATTLDLRSSNDLKGTRLDRNNAKKLSQEIIRNDLLELRIQDAQQARRNVANRRP
jgi:hypothetical protein